jgi:DNA-binding CsgD family transcriptional regulator/pimeloyl-ACP methyl ester carboxylesterase
MSLAESFLARFRSAAQADGPIGLLAEDPDGWAAAMNERPDDLHAAFEGALDKGHGPLVSLNRDCFATAACDEDGVIIAADPGFQSWFTEIDPFESVVRGLGPDEPRVSLLADDKQGRPVAIVAGNRAVARNWPLSDVVREALNSGKAQNAVAAFRSGELSWDRTAQAYGLTQAESGLVYALARLGDLQRAAAERGIAYETARKFVASALRKTGAKRQTELVRIALTLTAGEIPDAQNLESVMRDLFVMSDRQAQLSIIIAQGMTRERAAEILKLSENSVKADLKAVFQACGVENAVDLARLVAEINALKGLASACDVMITASGHEGEPLRLLPRTWGPGRLAIADHGPASGIPVLVMHSTVSGRHHPARFIQRLKREGYRPITMDRAGFGLSDRAEGDPVEAAIKDIADVLDALGLPDILAIARCTCAAAIAVTAGSRGLISGGILVWPDAPLPAGAPERRRMTDRAAQIFARFPHMAEVFVNVLARRTSVAVIEKNWRKAAEGVPSDLALLDDDTARAEIVRSARQAIQGLSGFLAEALANAKGYQLDEVQNSHRWTALFGSGFESYDVSDAVAFWGKAMPQGTIRVVEDGVHFLHVTHVDEVIAALRRAKEQEERVNVAERIVAFA